MLNVSKMSFHTIFGKHIFPREIQSNKLLVTTKFNILLFSDCLFNFIAFVRRDGGGRGCMPPPPEQAVTNSKSYTIVMTIPLPIMVV